MTPPSMKGGVKEFCTYWVRRGECDYTQQGCMFKHVMPTDRETLSRLGLRDIPRWYREQHGVKSLDDIEKEKATFTIRPWRKEESTTSGAAPSSRLRASISPSEEPTEQFVLPPPPSQSEKTDRPIPRMTLAHSRHAPTITPKPSLSGPTHEEQSIYSALGKVSTDPLASYPTISPTPSISPPASSGPSPKTVAADLKTKPSSRTPSSSSPSTANGTRPRMIFIPGKPAPPPLPIHPRLFCLPDQQKYATAAPSAAPAIRTLREVD